MSKWWKSLVGRGSADSWAVRLSKWWKSLVGHGTADSRFDLEIFQPALREGNGHLSEATVERLAQSIAEIGILHPIYVSEEQ